LVAREPVADDLPVPVGYGYVPRLGRNAIPEDLDVLDPLFHRKIIETGGRQL
jgi:hypothetical protein